MYLFIEITLGFHGRKGNPEVITPHSKCPVVQMGVNGNVGRQRGHSVLKRDCLTLPKCSVLLREISLRSPIALKEGSKASYALSNWKWADRKKKKEILIWIISLSGMGQISQQTGTFQQVQWNTMHTISTFYNIYNIAIFCHCFLTVANIIFSCSRCPFIVFFKQWLFFMYWLVCN